MNSNKKKEKSEVLIWFFITKIQCICFPVYGQKHKMEELVY